LTTISIASVIIHGGLNLGIDFAGGSIIQVKFQKDMTADKIRGALKSTRLENSIIQQFGPNEFLIRTAESFHDQKLFEENVNKPLTAAFNKDYEIRRVEVVGSKVGMDFQRKAIFAVILSWLAMLIYIAWRFEFRYGLGGIIALIHTIVVLDRIRENVKLNPRQKLAETINMSINQTLSRTILTSFTVFLTVLALYIFGGPVLHDLAFSLLVGVVFGTYSSVFISCPIVLLFENLQLSKMKRKK
jgi:preprotein translocase subunit SecF